MIFNSDLGKLEVDLNINNIIGYGIYGTIYDLHDGTCFKKYGRKRNNLSNEVEVSYNSDRKTYHILSKIRELNLKNFYKIHEICYETKFKLIRLDGYRMNFIKSENVHLLDIDIDYIISNYLDIINQGSVLASNKILIRDLNSTNLILNNDRITIIDCDSYKECSGLYDYNTINNLNKREIIGVFKKLILRECYNKYSNQGISSLTYYLEHLLDSYMYSSKGYKNLSSLFEDKLKIKSNLK